MKTIRITSVGNEVRMLQKLLGIADDGIFGPQTEAAVKQWQQSHGLVPDGVVGPLTWSKMQPPTTDISETLHPDKEVDFNADEYYLPENEYFKGPYPKQWMFLHHTAGWEDPRATVKYWGSDDRGRVATEFVIGGQSIKGTNNAHDGKLVHAFPAGGFGWHLGTGASTMHSNSVAVEVCSFGNLTKNKTGAFLTYTGAEVDPLQVVKLKKPFKGCEYWHRYSDKQIATLKELINDVSARDGIDMRKGLPELIKKMGVFPAFEYCNVNYASNNPGLYTHANVLSCKVDMFPQDELVDMIMSL